MGQEIDSKRFTHSDYQRYQKALELESEYLQQLVNKRGISNRHAIAGFELEACLLNKDMSPAAVNENILNILNDDETFSPELSQFNIEINGSPSKVGDGMFDDIYADLCENWSRCQNAARQIGNSLLMIGILPTLKESDLSPVNMSKMRRYQALNEQLIRFRKGSPIELDIQGKEHLHARHFDVMLEAATTSFQTHLQVSQDKVVRYFNAFAIASAPVVAITANAPFLFGKQLWQETRIPLFEQAVPLGGIDGASAGPIKRVSFGSEYLHESIMELFLDNLHHYPPLLPFTMDEEISKLAHLRLHNGTIWRWNRPIIGFDKDGQPHFRIEHRTMPAGPTPIDMMANLGFMLGLVTALAEKIDPPERQLPFVRCRDNFYEAAKFGLNAHVHWCTGMRGRMSDLMPKLVDEARNGLENLEVDSYAIELLTAIISERIKSRQTGAAWQIASAERYDGDLRQMTQRYQQLQEEGEPVHLWPI